MAVERKSLASLKAAIEAAVTTVETSTMGAINDVIGTSTSTGFATYNTCSALYTLATTELASIDSDVNDLLDSLVTDDLPTGLEHFDAIGLALQNIDAITNLQGANVSFDTVTEIVSYMIANNSTVENWLELNVNKFAIACGTSSFAGTSAGKTVTLTKARPNANYLVLVTPVADASGAIGDIYVTSKTTGSFTVINTGTATTNFDWILLDDLSVVSSSYDSFTA